MIDADQGDFDTPEEAAKFKSGLCPNCEGFGVLLVDEDRDDYKTCPDCDGTGQKTIKQ